MVLAIWAKFGPFRAKISKSAWETYPQNLTMYSIHKKVLKNGPSFVGGVFLIFGLGWILPEPTVRGRGPRIVLMLGQTETALFEKPH